MNLGCKEADDLFNSEFKQRVKKEINILAKEWLAYDLYALLSKTRQEPGLSIATVAQIVQQTLSWEEVEILKKLL